VGGVSRLSSGTMTNPPAVATSTVTMHIVANEPSAQVRLPQTPTTIAIEATTLIPASTTTNQTWLRILCGTHRRYAHQRPPNRAFLPILQDGHGALGNSPG
jgi:hypothetical protein